MVLLLLTYREKGVVCYCNAWSHPDLRFSETIQTCQLKLPPNTIGQNLPGFWSHFFEGYRLVGRHFDRSSAFLWNHLAKLCETVAGWEIRCTQIESRVMRDSPKTPHGLILNQRIGRADLMLRASWRKSAISPIHLETRLDHVRLYKSATQGLRMYSIFRLHNWDCLSVSKPFRCGGNVACFRSLIYSREIAPKSWKWGLIMPDYLLRLLIFCHTRILAWQYCQRCLLAAILGRVKWSLRNYFNLHHIAPEIFQRRTPRHSWPTRSRNLENPSATTILVKTKIQGGLGSSAECFLPQLEIGSNLGKEWVAQNYWN